jgi:bifunctional non-homologous end joining protein LigD
VRLDNWLKIKTRSAKRSSLPGSRPHGGRGRSSGRLTLALREGKGWRYIGHVGTGFSRGTLEELHGKLMKLKSAKSPFAKKVKNEAVTTWVKPSLVAEVKFFEWTSSGEMRHPVYLGLRSDKRAEDVKREREKAPWQTPLKTINQ